MLPTLLDLDGLKISAYGFFIALGYLAAVLLIRRLARSQGLDPAALTDACLLALVSGIVGSRALFVLTNLSYFSSRPDEIWRFWSGGLVFYGGFLLAAPIVILFLRFRRIPPASGIDILVPGLALGHAFGRLGCFAAGCCHGGLCPYPWGVHFDTDLVEPSLRGQPLHPTQLYESAGLFLLTGLLLTLLRRKPRPGLVASAYVTAYGLLRFVVEVFRGDTIRGQVPGTGLATSQGIALALFLLGGAFLIRSLRRDH